MIRRYPNSSRTDSISPYTTPLLSAADNLAMIAEHTVDVALVQAGVTRKDGTDDIVSLGTMFRQPVMIFYRASKPITLLSQLDGERIAVGHAGSGTQVLAMALLSANGIAEGGKTTFLELEGEADSAALLAHQADAVILSGDSADRKSTRLNPSN